tara:strand:- start:532 stop:1458 length:927 start_codon:yes stop_codon:yes gene_type:complete
MEMQLYNMLKTRAIRINNSKIQIDEDTISRAMTKCYKEVAFSTMPYFFNNMSSQEAMTQLNSGNCIAMSLYLKKHLKTLYNINSCLIPATIPIKYQREGFLDISHVALAVPVDNPNEDIGYYIIDTAFYFLNPILITKSAPTPYIIFSKHIYTPETNKELKNFTSISRISCELKYLDTVKKFNNWQSIEKGTYFVKCNDVIDIKDHWSYFLTEIINPDEAITPFFLRAVNPFITTTIIDQYGFPTMGAYLKIKNNILSYSYEFNNHITLSVDNLDSTTLQRINYDLKDFFQLEIDPIKRGLKVKPIPN